MKKWTDDPLFALEWSSARMALPLNARNGMIWAAAALTAVVVGVLLPDRVTPESIFACGAVIVALIASHYGLALSFGLWVNPFKDWWLMLPHPRESLIRAKLLAAVAKQMFASAAVWLVCLLATVVRIESGVYWTDPGAADRVPGDLLAYGLAYAAVSAVFGCFGFAVLGMNVGWRRWLLLPLALFVLPLYGLFPPVLGSAEAVQRTVSAGTVFFGSCAALLVAVPLWRGTIRFVTRYGLPELARYRSTELAVRNRKETIAAARFPVGGSGFRALLALERSRFRHLAALPPVRALAALLVLAAAAGGYRACAEPTGLLSLLSVVLMLAMWLPSVILSILNQTEANSRRIVWWLVLPFARRALLFARWTAVWTTVLRWAGGWLAGIAIGAAARWAAGGSVQLPWDRDGTTLLYLVAVIMGIGVMLSGTVLSQPASYRSPLAAWLFVPLSSLSSSAPFLVWQWLAPDRLLAEGVGPGDWRTAVLCAAGALALGGFGFAAGAKSLHLYLVNSREAVQRRTGAAWERRRPFS